MLQDGNPEKAQGFLLACEMFGAFNNDRELFEQLEGKVAADRWQKEATRHLHDKLLSIPQPTSVESYIGAF
jgi:hypothetical protein